MKPRILIVDDDATALMIIRAMLQSDCECRCERDGADALAAVEEFRPDVVVSDVVMPGLDGIQLTRTLKSRQEYRDIPVLLITAHDGETLPSCLDAGADDYLSKPLIEHEFRARVRAAVRLGRNNQRLRDTIAELATTRDHLRAVFDSTSDAIVSYSGEGRVLSCNRAATSLLGLDAGSAHQSVFDLPVPRQVWQPAEARSIHSLADTGRMLEFCVSSVYGGDLFVAVVRDVTAYFDVEAEISKARRHLAEASISADHPAVLAEVAHAIIDAMSGIQLQTGLVRDSLRCAHRRRLERLVDRLATEFDDQGSRARQSWRPPAYARQIAEMLDKEREFLEFELGALSERVQQVCSIAEPCLARSSHRGSVESLLRTAAVLADGADCVSVSLADSCMHASVDRKSVLEILVHLLSNSVDAVRRNQNPDVRVAAWRSSGGMLTIRVSDNGDVVDPAAMDQLLSTGYSDTLRSHGWGLRRCHDLACKLGGQLTVGSAERGVGTMVTLELPLAA